MEFEEKDFNEFEMRTLNWLYVNGELQLFREDTIAAIQPLIDKELVLKEKGYAGRARFEFTAFELTPKGKEFIEPIWKRKLDENKPLTEKE